LPGSTELDGDEEDIKVKVVGVAVENDIEYVDEEGATIASELVSSSWWFYRSSRAIDANNVPEKR
jgi:hypothetical protein